MATALRSDDDLTNARQRCVDLLRKATGPMHVLQPDGSTLRLCYLARIMRAQTMIDSVAPDLKPAVLARYWEIVEEANDAWSAYVAVRDAYLNRCAWAGLEPDEPVERECNCPVCSAYEPPTVHLGDVVDAAQTAPQPLNQCR